MKRQPLFLCAGPQSGGTTIVSWCFLQRADMDGVLDAASDRLPDNPSAITSKNLWCKTTISSFRMSEMITYLQDEEFDVRPMLVVRDVRAVFNSLIQKSYGRNGTTAEEPPIRLRLRRFKEDWELARRHGWPILRFESFVADAEVTLRRACEQLQLPWDEAMLSWPKSPEQIAAAVHGNPTFRSTRNGNLRDTLAATRAEMKIDHIPAADLDWLEAEFEVFNASLGYPVRLTRASKPSQPRATPSFEQTRRHRRARRRSMWMQWLWPFGRKKEDGASGG